MVKVWEDGSICGEIMSRTWGGTLPSECRIPNHERFFDIPSALVGHKLAAQPHHEEIIVSVTRSGEDEEGSFLMSQVPSESGLHAALTELSRVIQEIVQTGGKQ